MSTPPPPATRGRAGGGPPPTATGWPRPGVADPTAPVRGPSSRRSRAPARSGRRTAPEGSPEIAGPYPAPGLDLPDGDGDEPGTEPVGVPQGGEPLRRADQRLLDHVVDVGVAVQGAPHHVVDQWQVAPEQLVKGTLVTALCRADQVVFDRCLHRCPLTVACDTHRTPGRDAHTSVPGPSTTRSSSMIDGGRRRADHHPGAGRERTPAGLSVARERWSAGCPGITRRPGISLREPRSRLGTRRDGRR